MLYGTDKWGVWSEDGRLVNRSRVQSINCWADREVLYGRTDEVNVGGRGAAATDADREVGRMPGC